MTPVVRPSRVPADRINHRTTLGIVHERESGRYLQESHTGILS
jgi:hypothetical protein